MGSQIRGVSYNRPVAEKVGKKLGNREQLQNIGWEKNRKIMPTTRAWQHKFKTPKNAILGLKDTIFQNFNLASVGYTHTCLP